MTWARDTESALRSSNPIVAMEKWATDYKADLQKLIIKIRGSLPKLVRYIIVALVTTDVHARDIIDELCERKVSEVQDFLWQQQLRYYWETDVDDCMIRHSDAKVAYGYEYMGATSRLVITPLTDRCWLTLTGSYALKLGKNSKKNIHNLEKTFIFYDVEKVRPLLAPQEREKLSPVRIWPKRSGFNV